MGNHELGNFDSAKDDKAGIEEVVYRLDRAMPRPSLSELNARLKERYECERRIEDELQQMLRESGPHDEV